jgi:trans-aconitate methyltransferase
VQSLATLEEGATIVDLDTGPGLLAVELHKLWPRARIIGRFHHLEMFRFTFQQVADLLKETGFEKIEGEDRGWQLFVPGVKP